MLIFPAIDIYGGKVVRLFKGDYDQMTVYGRLPVSVAHEFEEQGATCLHIVDLEGARSGTTPNIDVVQRIARETGLFTEIGGGVRSMDVVRAYIEAGLGRVIIGTAAVTNPAFLEEALAAFGGERVAVGVDLRDGYVATHGWQEKSQLEGIAFCRDLEARGVRTVIVTDISKDGVLAGANLGLYRELSSACGLDIVASGGVSTLEDVRVLSGMGLYAAATEGCLRKSRQQLRRVSSTASSSL